MNTQSAAEIEIARFVWTGRKTCQKGDKGIEEIGR